MDLTHASRTMGLEDALRSVDQKETRSQALLTIARQADAQLGDARARLEAHLPASHALDPSNYAGVPRWFDRFDELAHAYHGDTYHRLVLGGMGDHFDAISTAVASSSLPPRQIAQIRSRNDDAQDRLRSLNAHVTRPLSATVGELESKVPRSHAHDYGAGFDPQYVPPPSRYARSAHDAHDDGHGAALVYAHRGPSRTKKALLGIAGVAAGVALLGLAWAAFPDRKQAVADTTEATQSTTQSPATQAPGALPSPTVPSYQSLARDASHYFSREELVSILGDPAASDALINAIGKGTYRSSCAPEAVAVAPVSFFFGQSVRTGLEMLTDSVNNNQELIKGTMEGTGGAPYAIRLQYADTKLPIKGDPNNGLLTVECYLDSNGIPAQDYEAALKAIAPHLSRSR